MNDTATGNNRTQQTLPTSPLTTSTTSNSSSSSPSKTTAERINNNHGHCRSLLRDRNTTKKTNINNNNNDNNNYYCCNDSEIAPSLLNSFMFNDHQLTQQQALKLDSKFESHPESQIFKQNNLKTNPTVFENKKFNMEDAEVEEILASTKELLPNNILEHYSNAMTATSSQYHPMLMMKMMMMNMANGDPASKMFDEIPNPAMFNLPSMFGGLPPGGGGEGGIGLPQEYPNSSPMFSLPQPQQHQQQPLLLPPSTQQNTESENNISEQNQTPIKSSTSRSRSASNRNKSQNNKNETSVADSTSIDHPLSSSAEPSKGHSENPMYRCHLCPYTGNSKQHFNTHMNSHFEHKCPHCDYTSRTEGRLKRHIRDFHSESPPETWGGTGLSDIDVALFEPIEEIDELAGPNPARNRKYRCKQCNYVATEKHEYWEHTKNHIKMDKMLACPKCNFVTEFKHHLVYHLRNHFGSKPFKCGKCNYSCVNKSMLNSHMKSHSNIYQYRCEDCTYATKYCHSLKLHLRKYNHRPATVLNLDGTPNPYPVIDVYGTRRGPRPKKGHKNVQDLEELEPLKQYALVAQADCDAQLPTTSGSAETSGSVSGTQDANANALKCDYCTFQTESKPDFAQHLLKHVITEKQILIKNKKKSVSTTGNGNSKKTTCDQSEPDTGNDFEDESKDENKGISKKKAKSASMSTTTKKLNINEKSESLLPTTTTPPPTPNNNNQNNNQKIQTPHHPLDQNIKIETKFFSSPSPQMGPSELTPPTPMEDISFGVLHSPLDSTTAISAHQLSTSSPSSSSLQFTAPLDLSSKPQSPDIESPLPQSSEQQLSAILLMNILQHQQQQNHDQEHQDQDSQNMNDNQDIHDEEEDNDDNQKLSSNPNLQQSFMMMNLPSQNILENSTSQSLSEEFMSKLSANNIVEYLEQQSQIQQQSQNQQTQNNHLQISSQNNQQNITNLANLFLPILQMNPTLNPMMLFQQFLPQLLTNGEGTNVDNVVGLLQKMHNATSLMQEILMEMCTIKQK